MGAYWHGSNNNDTSQHKSVVVIGLGENVPVFEQQHCMRVHVAGSVILKT